MSGTRPAFVAALLREIAPLVKGWQTDSALRARGIHLYWNEQAIVVCAGMGAQRATLAAQAAFAMGAVSSLTSIGWAGACDPAFHVGHVVEASVVIDARTGERFEGRSGVSRHSASGSVVFESRPIIVTVPLPSSVHEKRRLAETYSASAVEMEAAAVARFAQIHQLPFFAVKAISDEADFELPDMDGFVDAQGQFREAAFGLHVALRPWLWLRVLRMARSSKLAAENLSAALRGRIASGWEENR